jgi:hypothetical protein
VGADQNGLIIHDCEFSRHSRPCNSSPVVVGTIGMGNAAPV